MMGVGGGRGERVEWSRVWRGEGREEEEGGGGEGGR